MKSDWKNFLEEAGGVFAGGELLHFGNPERELQVMTTGGILCDLSPLGLIVLEGPDSVEFMQNLFCNDVRQVSPTHSQLSALCSPKGRILAAFRIFQRGAHYFLQLPRDMVEPTLKRLRMYVLRSKVSIEDASDLYVRIGLAGPKTDAWLAEAVSSAPAAVNDCAQYGTLTALRVPGIHPRFELVGEIEAAKKIWQRLAVQCTPVASGAWRLLDIRAGIPAISAATTDAFVPQMVNFEAINGLSFTKGCYPGQEVVARAHYLGKVKRHMYLAHVESPTPPRPGDTLYVAGQADEQNAGKVVDAHAAPDGGYDLLAVLQESAASPGSGVCLHSVGGPRLDFLDLPYQVA